ncbi:hypothetical protein HBI56_066860 [Parastagonospora nodorum]|uniref:Extracellular membrane protein CFEM domain-containing protein n=2 Tax=Phaeosphaeria nodorum (strain SN15 / ATCC MYA-4574 / FGSC 10173) TaxID=321614 RepID=A0A7U2ES44_PHANO|nr:hypothetical protein SNOG_09539 [Parastagonospora nodorum SN15]KAH3920213.1 hypothetical protein HBH56_001450 [Parastagonospora nodorum]EAT82804.1 hypothetical protein SNOG_09539 [Parastagonospora nodorum SN15]KAH3937812.1 hypothetical protein HBH54_001460 [Parastagonospora nodorum]KAH3940909.1 hypothetical protein HBH53_210760 [Parastagonospora nodorum]KAH3958523.1 hypothetical protein HBH51_209290 [Parastagonospora nodorum]
MANLRLATSWLLLTVLTVVTAQETYTNAACISATPAMNACAQRWDSIRTECTKSNTLNTVWPGPCECAYFANDLPCFDDQALCAEQVWTQVPQWFRDGVSSCLMKDSSFTVRAALGNASGAMGNPFSVPDLPGKLTRAVDAGIATATSTPARTGASAILPSATSARLQEAEGLSTGAKAGFGAGIGVVVVIIAFAAVLIARSHRRKSTNTNTHFGAQDSEKSVVSPPVKRAELHDQEKRVELHEHAHVQPAPVNEMPGTEERHEMWVRASTWLVELPAEKSVRNSVRNSRLGG